MSRGGRRLTARIAMKATMTTMNVPGVAADGREI